MQKRWLVLTLVLAVTLAACGTNPAPTISPGTPPPEASAAFQKILADCWGVAQMKEIDAKKEEHIKAFDCARERLLGLARDYPNFAETHRVLGWGYFYKNQDTAAARAEYQRAADIYRAQGKKADEADMYRRLALLYMSPTDTTRGCELLVQSLALDPQNSLTQQALATYFCLATPTPPTLLTPPPPAPNPTQRVPAPPLTVTPTRQP